MTATAGRALPRGIRNHNPGNIRHGRDRWQGMAAEQPDAEFIRFEAPAWGIRAMARILIGYQDRQGLRTIRAMIARWAPPVGDRNGAAPGGEYTQDTGSYAGHVARAVGVDPDEPVDVQRYEILRPMVEAMIRHENGQQPYTPAQIDKGLVLAGVEPPARPLLASGTIRGGLIAGSAAGGLAVDGIEQIQDTMATVSQVGWSVSSLLQLGLPVLAIVAVAAIGWMVWRRIDDRRRGLR